MAILRANNLQGATIRPVVPARVIYQVVEQLPTENIKTSVIYLTPKEEPTENDIYDKWLYVNGAWERVDGDGSNGDIAYINVTQDQYDFTRFITDNDLGTIFELAQEKAVIARFSGNYRNSAGIQLPAVIDWSILLARQSPSNYNVIAISPNGAICSANNSALTRLTLFWDGSGENFAYSKEETNRSFVPQTRKIANLSLSNDIGAEELYNALGIVIPDISTKQNKVIAYNDYNKPIRRSNINNVHSVGDIIYFNTYYYYLSSITNTTFPIGPAYMYNWTRAKSHFFDLNVEVPPSQQDFIAGAGGNYYGTNNYYIGDLFYTSSGIYRCTGVTDNLGTVRFTWSKLNYYTTADIDSMIGDIGSALDSLNADLAEV